MKHLKQNETLKITRKTIADLHEGQFCNIFDHAPWARYKRWRVQFWRDNVSHTRDFSYGQDYHLGLKDAIKCRNDFREELGEINFRTIGGVRSNSGYHGISIRQIQVRSKNGIIIPGYSLTAKAKQEDDSFLEFNKIIIDKQKIPFAITDLVKKQKKHDVEPDIFQRYHVKRVVPFFL